MEKNFILEFHPHDGLSDTLSTSPTSLNYTPLEAASPSNVQSMNSLENDVLSNTKKIRKKRNAYHKIDDNIRLKLFEAVQRGETLKSAAKRYQVNYSSAKSIFHIYRKEGRLLKKATQEKPFEFPIQNHYDSGIKPHLSSNTEPTRVTFPVDSSNFTQSSQHGFRPHGVFHVEETSGSSSPLNNLVDNFSDLLRIGSAIRPKEDISFKNKSFMPAHPSRFNPNQSHIDHSFSKIQPHQQMTLATKPPLMSPAEKMKQFGDFYMNYSNSPLSGRAKMIRKGSESGSNKNPATEFDSFSEMVTAFQNPSYLTENLKREPSIPKLLMSNMVQHSHERLDVKTPIEEEHAWNDNLESAALDTFKSFVDAQMVLSNAFKKASLLNNLVQIQKSKVDGSPNMRGFLNN